MSDRIREIIGQTIDKLGFILVETNVTGKQNSRTVLIFIDSETGVTVSDCARVSRRIWDMLEGEAPDLYEAIARIEVSSPGLDRPLQSESDFIRNRGRRVRIDFVENDEKKSVEGLIKGINRETVILEGKKGDLQIPLSAIKKAIVQVAWN